VNNGLTQLFASSPHSKRFQDADIVPLSYHAARVYVRLRATDRSDQTGITCAYNRFQIVVYLHRMDLVADTRESRSLSVDLSM
jgi:hypothetical protein